jgi:hypothetical protein
MGRYRPHQTTILSGVSSGLSLETCLLAFYKVTLHALYRPIGTLREVMSRSRERGVGPPFAGCVHPGRWKVCLGPLSSAGTQTHAYESSSAARGLIINGERCQATLPRFRCVATSHALMLIAM